MDKRSKTTQPPYFILAAAQTADGFIAKDASHRSTTWVSDADKAHFKALLESFDWVVVGRATAQHHAKVLGKYKCLVFTKDPATPVAPHLSHLNPETQDPIAFLTQQNATRVGILGGTGIYDYFLEKGLLDEAWITVEPLTFGEGIPTFTHPERVDDYLRLQKTTQLNETATLLRHYTRK